MSDLPLKLRELASVLEDPYLNQAADLIEQQQARVAELDATNKALEQNRDQYKREAYALAATVDLFVELREHLPNVRQWVIEFEKLVHKTPHQNLNHVKRDCLLILARDLSSTGEIESNIIECIELYANTKYPSGKGGENV